jgi:hypothetical protein
MLLTRKQKLLWNEAVRKTLNQVRLYDGIIPDERDRNHIATAIWDRLSYKSVQKKIS